MKRTALVSIAAAVAFVACNQRAPDDPHEEAVQRDAVAGHDHSDIEQQATGLKVEPYKTDVATQNTAGLMMTHGTNRRPNSPR